MIRIAAVAHHAILDVLIILARAVDRLMRAKYHLTGFGGELAAIVGGARLHDDGLALRRA
jgi:hypothetical protein